MLSNITNYYLNLVIFADICHQAGFDRIADINQELNKCCDMERKKSGFPEYNEVVHKEMVERYNREETKKADMRRKTFAAKKRN